MHVREYSMYVCTWMYVLRYIPSVLISLPPCYPSLGDSRRGTRCAAFLLLSFLFFVFSNFWIWAGDITMQRIMKSNFEGGVLPADNATTATADRPLGTAQSTARPLDSSQ